MLKAVVAQLAAVATSGDGRMQAKHLNAYPLDLNGRRGRTRTSDLSI
jgi:hypothetical protein